MSNRLQSSVPLDKAAEGVYRRLLRAYPRGFRSEYGGPMLQLFRDGSRAAYQEGGIPALLLVWWRTGTDWIVSVPAERWREVSNMTLHSWILRAGAVVALMGGVFGVFLLTWGPNGYGNYGWDGWLGALAALVLLAGFGAAYAAARPQLMDSRRASLLIGLSGVALMGIGYAIEMLWPLIFLGPCVVLPIGFIRFGMNARRRLDLSAWWRVAPLAVGCVGALGFGIEFVEGFAGRSELDLGVATTQAALALAWIFLGAELWLQPGKSRSDAGGLV